MGRIVIVTRRDSVDQHMADHWGRPLFDADPGSGNDLRFLDGPSRQEVESELAGCQVIAFFGHGLADALGSPALIDLVNVHRATGVIVAVACRSAKVLGRAALAGGAMAYVGFDDDLPVIDSPVIDSLFNDRFSRLLAGQESAFAFEQNFADACEKVQSQYFSYRRDDNAFLIGQSAQVLRLTLRVLERS